MKIKSRFKDISEFKQGDILDSNSGIVYQVKVVNKGLKFSKIENIGSGSILTATHGENKCFKIKD